MPFKSKQQAKKRYALKQKGQAGNWDCSEWAEKTDFRSIPQSKEAFSMTASPHLAHIKQAASMAVLQPAFQKLADDHFGGDINSAVAFCEQNRVHPAALLKMARPTDLSSFGTASEANIAKQLQGVSDGIHLTPAANAPSVMNRPGLVNTGAPIEQAGPTMSLKTKRLALPTGADAVHGTATPPHGGVTPKVDKSMLIKMLSRLKNSGRRNPWIAGGAAGALGLAGLGGMGRMMRGSPEAAGGGGMPADVAPGGGGLGGGAGGGAGAGAGGGGGMSPTMKALLGLGLVGGGAYGASRVMGGKKKKQASDNFANRVLTRVITKKASAVLRAESVRRVNTYLDKLASAVSFPEQAQTRLIQGNLAAGNSLAHAIKKACPNLPAESRGVFAAELVKKAAASVR